MARFGEWTSVDDELPELPARKSFPSVNVIATDGTQVRGLCYTADPGAKAERRRRPKWKETHGPLAWFTPTHWMPLPPAPGKEAR